MITLYLFNLSRLNYAFQNALSFMFPDSVSHKGNVQRDLELLYFSMNSPSTSLTPQPNECVNSVMKGPGFIVSSTRSEAIVLK